MCDSFGVFCLGWYKLHLPRKKAKECSAILIIFHQVRKGKISEPVQFLKDEKEKQ